MKMMQPTTTGPTIAVRTVPTLLIIPRRGLRMRGFTLIEMMIVAAVIAILAAIALPIYKSHIFKARRTDAKTALLDLATRQERFSTTNNSYTNVPGSLGYAGAFPVSVPSATEFNYGISVTASTTSSFTATAVPNGDQVNDTCGTYVINDQGVQSTTGGTTPSAQCWR